MSDLEHCFLNLRALNEAAKNLRGLGLKVEIRVEPRGSAEDIFGTMFGLRVARPTTSKKTRRTKGAP